MSVVAGIPKPIGWELREFCPEKKRMSNQTATNMHYSPLLSNRLLFY